MFARFYPNQPQHRAIEFQHKLEGKKISMAHLQGYLMLYKTDPLGAIEHADNVDSQGSEVRQQQHEQRRQQQQQSEPQSSITSDSSSSTPTSTSTSTTTTQK
jgi:hypothetical protein